MAAGLILLVLYGYQVLCLSRCVRSSHGVVNYLLISSFILIRNLFIWYQEDGANWWAEPNKQGIFSLNVYLFCQLEIVFTLNCETMIICLVIYLFSCSSLFLVIRHTSRYFFLSTFFICFLFVKDRWKLLCSICGVSYGACIQVFFCCFPFLPPALWNQ